MFRSARHLERAAFLRLLSVAVDRGLSPDRALETAGAALRSTDLQEELGRALAAVREGDSLAESLAPQSDLIPATLGPLLFAGLESSCLSESLRSAADQEASLARFELGARRVAIYVGAGAVVFVLILCFVMFARSAPFWGSRHPFPSGEGFLSVYHRLAASGPPVLAIALFGLVSAIVFVVPPIWLLVFLCRRSALRYLLPVFGPIGRSRDLSNACRILSMRLRAGFALPDALESIEDVFPAACARRAVARAASRAREGAGLAASLGTRQGVARWLFPRTLVWALGRAEWRGDVPAVLEFFARQHADEAERGVERLLALLSPLGVVALVNLFFLESAAFRGAIIGWASWDFFEISSFERVVRWMARDGMPFLRTNAILLGAVFGSYALLARRRDRLRFLAVHFAWLAGRGMPFGGGLVALGRDLGGPMGMSLRSMAADLDEGVSFPEAVRRRLRLFPPAFQRAVLLGDASGSLERRLGDYASRRDSPDPPSFGTPYLVLYPAILAAFLTLLATAVLPTVAVIWESLGVLDSPLFPWRTKALTRIGLWFRDPFAAHYAFLGCLLLAWILLRILRLARVRGFLRGLALRLPVAREPIRASAAESFAGAVGRMIEAGMPLPDAVRAAADAEPVAAYRRLYRRLEAHLREGGRLEPFVRDERLFPGEFAWHVRAGEAADRLPEHLLAAAGEFAGKVSVARRMAARLSVPLVAAVAGAVAALLLLGVMEPFLLLLGR